MTKKISKTLTAAVIGSGNMGKNHIRLYSENPQVTLVSIADTNPDILKELSNKFHTKAYLNYVEMLDREKPDLVSVCVPTSKHYEIAKKCLERKVNVLLEKPITLDVAEAKELVAIAKKSRVKFLIGHIERFNPAVSKVKELIDNGSLGKITAIILRRVGGFPPQIKDANIAADLAIHDVDIANYLLGELPKEVHINKQKNHIERREDSVEIFLKYGKASAYIQANWITPVKIRKINITGTEGYLEMDYINQNIDFYKSNYTKLKDTTTNFTDYILIFSQSDRTEIPVEKKEPLRSEIDYFINCVKNNINIENSYAVDALNIVLS